MPCSSFAAAGAGTTNLCMGRSALTTLRGFTLQLSSVLVRDPRTRADRRGADCKESLCSRQALARINASTPPPEDNPPGLAARAVRAPDHSHAKESDHDPRAA